MEISNLSDKKFKVMILKMFNELRRRMDEHSEKINKELGNIKKNQTEMNTITKRKIHQDFSQDFTKYTRINSRFDSTEEWMSILENQVVEITQAEQKTEKKLIQDSLQDLQDNIKHSNICIIGVPKGEDRKRTRIYLKK